MSDIPNKLKYCAGGKWLESKTKKNMDCYNPSTGEVIARAPQCTAEEVEAAILAAHAVGGHPCQQPGAGSFQDEGSGGKATG